MKQKKEIDELKRKIKKEEVLMNVNLEDLYTSEMIQEMKKTMI